MATYNAAGFAKSSFWTQTNAIPPSSRASTEFPTEYSKRSTQLKRMLCLSLLQCLLTASLSFSIYGTLWGYSKNEALPSRKKQELDMLIISISIVLSLTTASSLKVDVRRLRWWLLSLHWYTPREADLILQSDKLWCLVLLGWRARHRTIQLFVFVFLVLNMASQVFVALLGLAYNVSPADKFTLTEPGLVLIPDMSDFGIIKELGMPEYDEYGQDSQALDARRYIANRYGTGNYNHGQSPLETMARPGTIFQTNDPVIYSTGEASYTYAFYEEEPSETSRGLKAATNRSVSVHANCDARPVIQGRDGFNENITVRYENGSNRVWQLPVLQGRIRPCSSATPRRSRAITGPLSKHSAHREQSPGVTLATSPSALWGVDLMRCAAPAIALQGYGASSSIYTNNTKRYQFQSHPAQTFYGLSSGGVASAVASKVAQVAITSIAVQAQTSSGILRAGMVPVTGISLEVKPWGFVYLILGLIVGVQLFVAIVSVFVANRVQVRSHNHVSLPALPHSTQQAVSRPAGEEHTAAMMGKDMRLMYVPEEDGTCQFQSKQF